MGRRWSNQRGGVGKTNGSQISSVSSKTLQGPSKAMLSKGIKNIIFMSRTSLSLSFYIHICIYIYIYIYKFAGPSAQRRVGILSGWSNGQRVLLSIDPGDPCRPETWRRRILESLFRPFGAPRPDFSIFWSIGRASKNDDFLASHQNVKNQRISRTWEAHVAILDQKT